MSDYEEAEKLGITNIDRWGKEIPHHPETIRMMSFLVEHDFNEGGDFFGWKVGGDGDNGEFLMYQMDAYFEYRQALEGKQDG